MMLFVGTSTVFPSLVFIQETFGSNTVICPINVLPSRNRIIFCLTGGGGIPGRVCCRNGVITGVAEGTARARTTLFPRHAGQTIGPVPWQTLHKTVALTSTCRALTDILGKSIPYLMTSPTWSLVQACHPLGPLCFCQSSLGSWPGTFMCSHLHTDCFLHFPGQSTCPLLPLEALDTIEPVPPHLRHFTRGTPDASTVGV